MKKKPPVHYRGGKDPRWLACGLNEFQVQRMSDNKDEITCENCLASKAFKEHAKE